MRNTLSLIWRGLLTTLRWLWRSFRRLPLVVQLIFASACLVALLVGLLVGNMGLALMGTAFGIWGAGVGAIGGGLAILFPWMAKHTFLSKWSGR